MSIQLTLVSSLSLLSLGACASQVDGGDQGTALATLSGSVQISPLAPPPPPAEVAVVWVVPSGGPSSVGADTVEVAGSFPAQFELSIYIPPTPDMLTELDGDAFGIGYIVAGEVGSPDHTDSAGWLGAELDQVLVYLPATPPAGSALSGFLRGTPAPGFHLYDVRRLTETERQARFQCISDIFNANPNAGMPTLKQIYVDCGGSGSDELSLATGDLAAPLSIQIVDNVDVNDLPQW
ncbi:MAG: hypothetical protein M3680_30985 [Myxococcota bacterium]|nr:hypothetical protein [Myxococcota bacterium]